MTARPIRRILIANRGEIARRILRTCREMGIATVAVCSDPDRDAPFSREADECVPIGGAQPGESYLRSDLIIAAAQRTGADAIHPGYGFLSENAQFARDCQTAGLTFIGPTPEAMAAMGSKIEAKRRMQAAGVPLLPTLEVAGQPPEQLLKEINAWGWPILVKASAGGGGRGMRVVRAAAEFAAMLDTARAESQAAFGDGALFIEPYVEGARHVEVQIFGDQQGRVVHLFERECSIQRRHQKVIEEAPCAAIDESLRDAITSAAVKAGQAIGYVNAGTVEFLLAPGGKFYFLEVNTRLQVEHPVTECITGLDLVRLQILVAAGEPLPPAVLQPRIKGHAIEARLYAEDPSQGYLPSAGTLHCFSISGAGVRVDAAYDGRAEVSPYYDALLAKVIVHAPTREEAAHRLAAALRHARLHGLRTNHPLLVRTLEHPDFLAGRTDTLFLERHDVAALSAPLADQQAEQLHAAAAALAGQAERRRQAPVLSAIPSGWRNNPSEPQHSTFRGVGGEIVVQYRFAREGLMLRVGGQELAAPRFEALSPEQVRLEVDGVSRIYDTQHYEQTWYVDSSLGSSTLEELPRFPLADAQAAAGSLMAPLPGVVHELRAKPGDTVEAGDVVLVIESMKVHHWISAPLAGRVAELRVEQGAHVQSGAILAVIEPA